MSPQKHLLVGVGGGIAVGLFSGNPYLGVGFFMGSWAIDLDHLWQYWRINNFDKPFSVKEFFKFNDKHGRKFGENPYLHLLFGHTVEINLLLLFLAMLLGDPISLLFWGMLFGSMIHLALDDINMYRGYVKRGKFPWFMFKRCHSIVEFYIRKYFLKEKEYSKYFAIRIN